MDACEVEDMVIRFIALCGENNCGTEVLDVEWKVYKEVVLWLQNKDTGGTKSIDVKKVFNNVGELCLEINITLSLSTSWMGQIKMYQVNLDIIDMCMPKEHNKFSNSRPAIHDCRWHQAMKHKWHHLCQTFEVFPDKLSLVSTHIFSI